MKKKKSASITVKINKLKSTPQPIDLFSSARMNSLILVYSQTQLIPKPTQISTPIKNNTLKILMVVAKHEFLKLAFNFLSILCSSQVKYF